MIIRITNIIDPVAKPIVFDRVFAIGPHPAMAASALAVTAFTPLNAPDEEEEAKSLTERLQSRWTFSDCAGFPGVLRYCAAMYLDH